MLVLSADMSTLQLSPSRFFNIDITGNTGTTDGERQSCDAQIHAAATSGQPGTNAGVVFGVVRDFPFNDYNPNNVGRVAIREWRRRHDHQHLDRLSEGNNTTLSCADQQYHARPRVS
jgi:hypothetical protein